MGFNHATLSFRDVDMSELTTKTFLDARGHSFEVTYDVLTGLIFELTCVDPATGLLTIVKKQPGSVTLWLGKKVTEKFVENSLDDFGRDSIPGLTRYLSDARFDEERGELKLASQKRTKRWTFRINGISEFYGTQGHIRLK